MTAEITQNWDVNGKDGVKNPANGSFYLNSTNHPWVSTEYEGFYTKSLYEDSVRGEKTLLMKVDAGAYAPEHSHDKEFEQIYVLEGSFYDQSGTLHPGDYCCRTPGANHSAGSDDGAVVMLVYTRRDPISAQS